MKGRTRTLLGVAAVLLAAAGAAQAVDLVVDTAPNVYGSPNWAPWWAQAQQDVVNGTFVNMRSGLFPGTTDADHYEDIVMSTMDLGQRLHWIYWLPGEATGDLTGRLETKMVIDWYGQELVNVNSAWEENAPEVGWKTPSAATLVDYDDGSNIGVVGNMGWAWWATDDDAVPYDTDGNAYNETDQADVDALRDALLIGNAYVIGQVRYRDSVEDDWQYSSLQVNFVPEPACVAMLGLGGLMLLRRKR